MSEEILSKIDIVLGNHAFSSSANEKEEKKNLALPIALPQSRHSIWRPHSKKKRIFNQEKCSEFWLMFETGQFKLLNWGWICDFKWL